MTRAQFIFNNPSDRVSTLLEASPPLAYDQGPPSCPESPTDDAHWVQANVILDLSSFAGRANVDRLAQLCQAGLGDGDIIFRFATAENGE
jgi:hypothetical protein